VVEGARLESVYAGNRIEGSNPSPSANYLSNPIIRLVSVLPGCSLATYLAIWDRSKLEGRGRPVTLPNAFALDPWGVDRHSKARALRALEGAGLISVTRSIGRAPRITLLDPRGNEMGGADS
jgi:hypothetical protein